MLDRQFPADEPNRKWVADFAFICTAESWPHVAAVLELFSRPVGWSMQSSISSQLVVDALKVAVCRPGGPTVNRPGF